MPEYCAQLNWRNISGRVHHMLYICIQSINIPVTTWVHEYYIQNALLETSFTTHSHLFISMIAHCLLLCRIISMMRVMSERKKLPWDPGMVKKPIFCAVCSSSTGSQATSELKMIDATSLPKAWVERHRIFNKPQRVCKKVRICVLVELTKDDNGSFIFLSLTTNLCCLDYLYSTNEKPKAYQVGDTYPGTKTGF